MQFKSSVSKEDYLKSVHQQEATTNEQRFSLFLIEHHSQTISRVVPTRQ